MTRLYNLLLRLIQYFNIFYGFTYIYIDIENLKVKYSIYIKIYVYCINLIQAFITISYFLESLKYTAVFLKSNTLMEILFLITFIIRFLIFLGLLWFRIQEEKYIKKWFKLFKTLQITSYDKMPKKSRNNTMKKAQIFCILIIFLHALYTGHKILPALLFCDWRDISLLYTNNFFIALEKCILFHHSFILSYINFNFLQLNNQLKNQKLQIDFFNIYRKFSLILKQVNRIYGSLIFSVLFCQIIGIASFAYTIFLYIINNNLVNYTDYIEPCIMIMLSFNNFLYFLICNEVSKTTIETGGIIKEYTGNKLNQEV